LEKYEIENDHEDVVMKLFVLLFEEDAIFQAAPEFKQL
jgi:hypothetical protein